MLGWWVAVALAAEEAKGPAVDPAADPHRVVAFEVDEGTWMNVDVAPSGDRVAFDLLGHVYVVPLSGGKATALTSGHAWNMHPRFSPDGRRIAFVSDRDGSDEVWVMGADGRDPVQRSTEGFKTLAQPDWTPDGRWVVARLHVTGRRSLGTGEVWAWPATGKAEGIRWTEAGHLEADVQAPHVSPDGRWLYVAEAGPFDYNRDPYGGIYGVTRIELATGERQAVAGGAGGAHRPMVSPDGRTLGYLRRHLDGQRTTWVLRDLATGAERVAFDGLDRDQQETWAIHGTSPQWDWLPDSSGAVFSFDGGLHVVSTAGAVTDIPFRASVSRPVVTPSRPARALDPVTFDAAVVRWPTLGPDRTTLLYQAVGRVWVQPKGAEARPLSPDDRLAYAPAWRPDGRAVAYTTWDDADGGMLWLRPLPDGRPPGVPVAVGDVPDLYTNPAFSPDGARLVWVQGEGATNRGSAGDRRLRVRWRTLPDGEIHEAGTVATLGNGVRPPRPMFAPDGRHLWVADAVGDNIGLVQLTLDGLDRRVLATGTYVAEVAPSPDGRWIAWKAQHQAYVAAWPPTVGTPLALGTPGDAVPAVRLSRELGEWLRWTDADTLTYASGATVYRVDLGDGLPDAPDAPKPKATKAQPWPDRTRSALGRPFDARVTARREVPEGTVALVGGRIVTMAGDRVIDDGTLVVRGERIVAVGPRSEVAVPDGATVIDVGGTTLIPGLVDVHAHMGFGYADVSPETVPAYAANLAYGVTTTHDPSADSLFVFSQAELVRAGRMVGPRITSTGGILYGAEMDEKAVVESLDDARLHLRRIARYGGFSVKSYNQPRRDQRQWILAAAREEGMVVVPEGGSTLQWNLTQIVDGHAGVEHALPVEDLRADVVRLWAATPEVQYTPTLLVGYGGVWGENAFFQRDDVWTHPRLQRFTRPGVLESRGKRRPLMTPPDDWHHVRLAQTAWRLAQAGVRVNLGAHGQLQGLGPHWELWALGEGGFPPLEALRAATANGARYLGLDGDIGSLEVGKYADVVVIDGDPLADLTVTDQIRWVLKGGVVYDPDTLATVWPRASEPLPTPWHDRAGGYAVPWSGDDGTGCGHALHRP